MSEKPTVPCPECGAVNWYHVAWYWSCGGKDGHPCGHIYGVSESPRPDDNTLEKLRVFASGNYSYSCDAEGKKILQLLDWAEHLEACIAELEAERDNLRESCINLKKSIDGYLDDIMELKAGRDELERQLAEFKKPPSDLTDCDCHSVPGDSKLCKAHTERDYHFFTEGLKAGKELLERGASD